jgi:hypothetical protein
MRFSLTSAIFFLVFCTWSGQHYKIILYQKKTWLIQTFFFLFAFNIYNFLKNMESLESKYKFY